VAIGLAVGRVRRLIGMIREFLHRRKVNKAHIEALEWNRHYEKMKLCEAQLKRIEEKMLSTPCSINNMDNCTKTCVHYKAGFVSELEFFDTVYAELRKPRCKLWK